ncbi:Mariner transposase [Nesidiocoris tenuis]|uniref:Mariner transposase n=1 Tax=Nesidiocoris tenuis TaxID=355587 RepID=A0ABN7AJL4_9HEMI|nr:Mariner transposase [Nesidiocoris tenuis]
MFMTRREVANRRSRMRLFKRWRQKCSKTAVKKHLGGKKFDTDAEVQKEVNTWLRGADGEWYTAGIDKFIVRMRKVLEKNGDYVEK